MLYVNYISIKLGEKKIENFFPKRIMYFSILKCIESHYYYRIYKQFNISIKNCNYPNAQNKKITDINHKPSSCHQFLSGKILNSVSILSGFNSYLSIPSFLLVTQILTASDIILQGRQPQPQPQPQLEGKSS